MDINWLNFTFNTTPWGSDYTSVLNGTTFTSQNTSQSDIHQTTTDYSDFTNQFTASPKKSLAANFFQSFTPGEIVEINSKGIGTANKRLMYLQSNKYRNRTKQNHVCSCGGCMDKSHAGTEYICSLCGTIDKIVGGNVDNISGVSNISMGNYNTSSDSATPIKVSGPGTNQLQRKLQCKTSEYTKVQYRELVRLMENLVAKSKHDIPKNVIMATAKLYHEIQKKRIIKRGAVFHGAMCACMKEMCDKNGISRKRRVLIEIFKIEPSDLSVGEKFIEELKSTGKLDRSLFPDETKTEETRINGFIKAYFIDLNIPLPEEIVPALGYENFNTDVEHPDYYDFVERLIRFSIKFKVAMSSIASSKCAGALFMLATRCPGLKITVQKISKVCDISISTFKRYYTVINDLLTTPDPRKKRLKNKLKHLFKKYRIPISA